MSKKRKQKKNQSLFTKVGAGLALIAIVVFVILKFTGETKIQTGKKNKSTDYQTFTFTKHGELTFTKSNGDFITRIDIEIADDDAERAQGLMYRSKMKEDRGMLFIFPKETYQSFWMHNTQIPLDMIFINKENKIVTIHNNTTPFSDQSYPSTQPAIYVLEVNAGFCEKYGVTVGDMIVWRRI